MPYKDSAVMTKYIRYRYLKLKLQAIEYKGGSCQLCGYSKYYNLTFHHRDPTKKDRDWSMMRKWGWDKIKKELNKCDLLCMHCHGDTHHFEHAKENDSLLAWGASLKR